MSGLHRDLDVVGEVLVPGGSEHREKEKQDNDWKSNVAAQGLCASLRLRFLNRETLGVSVRIAAGSPGWDSCLGTSHVTLEIFTTQSKESTSRNRQPMPQTLNIFLPCLFSCSKGMLEISS